MSGGPASKGAKQKASSLDDEVDRLLAEIRALADGDGPVIAGPFTGEVGFELLYWIPLLRWAIEEIPALRGRLVVVSRGGVAGWVEGLDASYVDLLTLFTPERFAAHRALADKQREVREFDVAAIDAVERHLGIGEATVLHPSVLYRAYFRFLKLNQLAYSRRLAEGSGPTVRGLASVYEPIPRPARSAAGTPLPDDYVAVRFYSRDSFPESSASAAFASAVIEALARVGDVVLIGNPVALDEHRDVRGLLPERVVQVDHVMAPATNLATQTAIVANARAFVGTYGGFSYLAPFLGVPSISFSTVRGATQPWHHELAQGIFGRPGWGGYVALQHTDLPLVELVTRGFEVAGGSIGWADEAATLWLSGGVRGQPDQL